MNKRFFHAIATLIGMIIGVGIFGIPYAVQTIGFFPGVILIAVLGLILLLIHLLYGEIILRTEGEHRLVGFAKIYLGKWGYFIASLSQILTFYGALLAYIIVGGQFLHIILEPVLGGNVFVYQFFFFFFMSIGVLLGLKLVAWFEFFMTSLLLLTVTLILIFGFPYVWYENLYVINLKQIFLPYGVILFALGGAAAIPEIREILRGQEEKMKKAIILGTSIPIIVAILFTLVVIGVCGLATSPDALSGLSKILGHKIIFVGAFFGFLAIATSFLVLGLNLKNIFNYDFKLNNLLSWILACVLPFLVFLQVNPSFISIISFTGAVLGGLEGILIILIWLKSKKLGKLTPQYTLTVSKFVIGLILIIFVFGIISRLIY
jgi:tyrosine-specific transport protein